MPQPDASMTVEDFLVWAEARPGRHELVDGRPQAIAPERVGHAEAKFAAQTALLRAIGRAVAPCRVLPGGVTVRIDACTAYVPDALVYRGARLSRNTLVVESPVIVVEVLSPSTGFFDRHGKLAGYFTVPSIRHYLVVDIDRRLVVHHERVQEGAGDALRTRLLPSGPLRLDPPGLEVTVEDLLGPA